MVSEGLVRQYVSVRLSLAFSLQPSRTKLRTNAANSGRGSSRPASPLVFGGAQHVFCCTSRVFYAVYCNTLPTVFDGVEVLVDRIVGAMGLI
jgi:hypothetical protein